MGNVNQFEQPKQVPLLNAIDAIAGALKAAHAYYGIDTEKAQGKLAELKAQQAQEESDPNSKVSKIAQGETSTALKFGERYGVKPDSTLLSYINGTPAHTESQYPGFPGPAIQNEVAATPGASAAQLNAMKEANPVFGMIRGEQEKAAKQAGFQFRDDQLQDRQDYMAHQKNLSKLKGDKQLGDMVNNSNNLTTTLSNLDKLGTVTKQDYEDLQNMVISNMGVKGQGGVGERAKRYAESLGMNGDALAQFLTGKPTDISQGNPLYDRYKEVAGLELGNFRGRIANRIAALTAGNKSMYDRRPDLKADLLDATGATTGQLNLGGSGAGATPAMASPGSAAQPAATTPGGLPSSDELMKEIQRRQQLKAAGGQQKTKTAQAGQ